MSTTRSNGGERYSPSGLRRSQKKKPLSERVLQIVRRVEQKEEAAKLERERQARADRGGQIPPKQARAFQQTTWQRSKKRKAQDESLDSPMSNSDSLDSYNEDLEEVKRSIPTNEA